jgi:hypothetical protein
MNPYELTKKTVALIGMAESHRDLAPWDNPEVEIWGINESYAERHLAKRENKDDPRVPYMRRWDRWFQMHPQWDFMRPGNFNHQNHPLWIVNKPGQCMACWGKGKAVVAGKLCGECGGEGWYVPSAHRREEMGYPFPIYTLEDEPAVPGSAKYPLEDVVALLGPNVEHAKWFTNSFGYMMALALLLGAQRIESYGFEMSSSTEYGEQKPNAAFWAGICMGAGVEFVLPPGCALLGAKDGLYGYEKVPGFTKMHAEIQTNGLQKSLQKLQGELNQVRGAKKALIQKAQATKGTSGQQKFQRELGVIVNQEIQAINALNAMFGAFQQARRVQAEVSLASSVAEIGYLDLDGKRHMIDLATFEAEARQNIQDRVMDDDGRVAIEDMYGA